MNTGSQSHEKNPWIEAVGLIHRWIERGERSDELLSKIDDGLDSEGRARVQNLVFGVMRHHVRVAKLLEKRLQRVPRHKLLAILQVAGYELIVACGGEDPAGTAAKIVHHAVEQSKRLVAGSEQKLVNAVLRRVSEDLLAQTVPGALAQAQVLADYFSHPEWLVKRWFALFGAKATRSMLEWNQQPAPVYARIRNSDTLKEVPSFLKPSAWAGFYTVEHGHWRELEPMIGAGLVYVQDPSTRLCVELLDPKKGECVLDLCASPGGKSLACADRMGGGSIVAVDLPGARNERLRENLSRIQGVATKMVETDISRFLPESLRAAGAPASYNAVLLDAPCSNTGVMRHRVDVKDRLDQTDIAKHGRQQLKLLFEASLLVADGGRLVYSTCSIDPDENENVVKEFLAKATEFTLEKQVISKPWESGHDGAGAFLLRKAK